MNAHRNSNIVSCKSLAASLALLLLACAALCDDGTQTTAKAKATSKVRALTAKKTTGAASAPKGSGPTTAPHGPTTISPSHTATTTSHTTIQTKKPGLVTERGQTATLHDPKRGMDIHHSLSGNRRVEVERPDHSRIVTERNGRGYVQKPYKYRGHEYAQRSYYYNGRYHQAYYGRYQYHGVWVNPYYPAYYYAPAYYSWVSYPWGAPASYAWGWNVNPWFAYYGGFFTPFAVYPSASLWLTDYIIATSLADAYQPQAAALRNPAPLTPEIERLIADEVHQQLTLEFHESQTAANGEPDAGSSSIQRMLTDGKPHVFIAGHDLDVVDAAGTACALTEGDVIQLTGQTAPGAQAATLAVLASKGGNECGKGDTVSVGLADLQEMQNHLRETIDRGLQELRTKQGQGGLPVAPAAAKAPPVESPMAEIAPPPPPESEVAAQIAQQSQEADQAEKAASSNAAAAPGPNAP
ncbi:MAG: hypothetical protein ABSG65_25020 [Bryobacteraceae bacterium]|jgi:hypothetical protein